jgi:hypothetical protein
LCENRQPHPSLPEVTAPVAALPITSVKKGNEEIVNGMLKFY